MVWETENLKPAVHPRAYGEHSFRFKKCSFIAGSSPCLRGTLDCDFVVHNLLRFIPVLTGNTAYTDQSILLPAVHPRAYGEHTREERCN